MTKLDLLKAGVVTGTAVKFLKAFAAASCCRRRRCYFCCCCPCFQRRVCCCTLPMPPFHRPTSPGAGAAGSSVDPRAAGCSVVTGNGDHFVPALGVAIGGHVCTAGSRGVGYGRGSNPCGRVTIGCDGRTPATAGCIFCASCSLQPPPFLRLPSPYHAPSPFIICNVVRAIERFFIPRLDVIF